LAITALAVLVLSFGGAAQGAVSDITIDSATLVPGDPGNRYSGDVIVTGTYECTDGTPQVRGHAVQGPAEADYSGFWSGGGTCDGTTQSYSIQLANVSKVRMHPGPATISIFIADTDFIADPDGEVGHEETVFLEH
jgi:hypothetical protein